MISKSSYIVEQTSYSQCRNSIISLWTEGFKGMNENRADKRFLWMYKNNPAGNGLFFILRDVRDNEVVGIQCLGKRAWNGTAGELKLGTMADLVVEQKQRSLGPALQLVKGVISQSAQAVDVLYGFPNRKAQVIFKRSGYKELGGMVRYAKVLRSNRYLSGKVPAWLSPLIASTINLAIHSYGITSMLLSKMTVKGEWVDHFDARFDGLWEKNKRQFPMISDRSAKVLNWRYFSGPDKKNWKIFIISRGNEILGYIVANINNGTAIISDFAFNGSTKNLFYLFSQFIWRVLRLGCQSVTFEFFGDKNIVSQLGRLGFQPRESHPIHFLLCNDKLAGIEECDWYVTGFDRDT